MEKNIQILQNIQKTLILRGEKKEIIDFFFIRKNYIDRVILRPSFIFAVEKLIKFENRIIDVVYCNIKKNFLVINNKNQLLCINLIKNKFFFRYWLICEFLNDIKDLNNMKINIVNRILIISNFSEYKFLSIFENDKFYYLPRIKRNILILNKFVFNYSLVLVNYQRYTRIFSIEGHRCKPYLKLLVSYKFINLKEIIQKKIEKNLQDSSFKLMKVNCKKLLLFLCIFSKINLIMIDCYNLFEIFINFPCKKIEKKIQKNSIIDLTYLVSKKFIFLIYISFDKFLFFTKINRFEFLSKINAKFLQKISILTTESKFLPNGLLIINKKNGPTYTYRLVCTGKFSKVIDCTNKIEKEKNLEKLKIIYFNFKVIYVKKFKKKKFFLILCKCQNLFYLKFYSFYRVYVCMTKKNFNRCPLKLSIIGNRMFACSISIFFNNKNIKTFLLKNKKFKKIYLNQLIYNQKTLEIIELKNYKLLIQITIDRVRLILNKKYFIIKEWICNDSVKIISNFLNENSGTYIYLLLNNYFLVSLNIDNHENLVWLTKYIIKNNYLYNIKGVTILNSELKRKLLFFFSIKDRYVKCFNIDEDLNLKLKRIFSQKNKIKSLIISTNKTSYFFMSKLGNGFFCITTIDNINLSIKKFKKIFLSEFDVYFNQDNFKEFFLIGKKVWKVNDIFKPYRLKIFYRKYVNKFGINCKFLILFKSSNLFIYKKRKYFFSEQNIIKTNEKIIFIKKFSLKSDQKSMFIFLIQYFRSICSKNLDCTDLFPNYEFTNKLFWTNLKILVFKKELYIKKKSNNLSLMDLLILKKNFKFSIFSQFCMINKNFFIIPLCFNYNNNYFQKCRKIFVDEKLSISSKIFIFCINKILNFKKYFGGRKLFEYSFSLIMNYDFLFITGLRENLLLFQKILDNRYLFFFENLIIIIELENMVIQTKNMLYLQGQIFRRANVLKNYIFITNNWGEVKIIKLDCKHRQLISIANVLFPFLKLKISILDPFTYYINRGKTDSNITLIDHKIYKNNLKCCNVLNSEFSTNIININSKSEIFYQKFSTNSLKLNFFKFFKLIV
ncbi:hypothetical protein (nucleomorph) [Guillardia theta]|uniref:RSE1/DDB1/CPSF1 second beta-propeller domain-containing protein n=2 Tax=Guillardia theta TaxID=55529 RepID=Q98RY9_GUITH|nr:hypothetical protein GTHECHR1019 [Guillardia theta]AAK39811.1 hypothetical protein [Guillardia theta]